MSYALGPATAQKIKTAPASRSPEWRHSPVPHGNQALLRRLQAKLAVGPVDDPLEREADAVAERVMRMADPAPVSQASPLQLSRKCAECEEEDKQKLQKKSAGAAAGPQIAPPIVHEVLRSPGRPLDPATRAFMEPRFGHDFGSVRVHTDESAAISASRVGATAYTAGLHIAFASRRYAPGTFAGRRLLAHELAHTLQQGAVQGSRIQRDAADVATLDAEYRTALQMGDWQAAAEWLNAFNHEDIQARLAELSSEQIASLHQGAVDNPRVGPQSQVAQLTEPGVPPASTLPPLASAAADATSVASPATVATPAPSAAPAAPAADKTSQMSAPEKLVEAIRRGMQSKQLGHAVKEQLNALLDPEAVSIAILFWMASHYDGLGELLDAAALLFEGLQFKAILEDLWDYAAIAIEAETDADLDRAGEKFASALVAAGVLKLMSILEKFGKEREAAGGKAKPREGEKTPIKKEGEKTPTKEEEQPRTKEEKVPRELEGFCSIGSLNCSSFPESALKEVGDAPHQDLCPMPEGPWELRGGSDATYKALRSEGPQLRQEKYLSRPDLWSPEFREAYAKAGNVWPESGGEPWQVHHRKPISFGGDNAVENFVALEPAIHAEITTYFTRLRAALARPFGGLKSPRWGKIMGGMETVDL